MCLNPKRYPTTYGRYVACGKCIECRLQRTREWAYRIIDEASLYPENDFLTLTYNASSLPDSGSLRPMDLQKFLKRLRKAISPRKVRFFACGEYGRRGGRPHYHVVLFGYRFLDRYPWSKDNAGNVLYRSPTLERLWSFGYSVLGDVDEASAFYVAKYMQKRVTGRKPPFLRMSNRPGIGYAYALKNTHLFESDKDYFQGRSIPLPRYYIRALSADGLTSALDCKARRFDHFMTASSPDFGALEERAKKFSRNLSISLDKVLHF